MPEEFGRSHAFAKHSHIHRNHGTRTAMTAGMQRTRDQLLARSGLPFDQDRVVAAREPNNAGTQVSNRVAVSHDSRDRVCRRLPTKVQQQQRASTHPQEHTTAEGLSLKSDGRLTRRVTIDVGHDLAALQGHGSSRRHAPQSRRGPADVGVAQGLGRAVQQAICELRMAEQTLTAGEALWATGGDLGKEQTLSDTAQIGVPEDREAWRTDLAFGFISRCGSAPCIHQQRLGFAAVHSPSQPNL